MGRVIGIQKDPETGHIRVGGVVPRDDRFAPVIDLIHRRELYDQPLLTPPCKDRDQADDVRNGILRACRYYCSCGQRHCTRKYPNTPHDANPQGGCPDGGERVSGKADVVKDSEGRLRVQVTFYRKHEAIREVIRKYGPDPANWPYFAKAKQLKKEDD